MMPEDEGQRQPETGPGERAIRRGGVYFAMRVLSLPPSPRRSAARIALYGLVIGAVVQSTTATVVQAGNDSTATAPPAALAPRQGVDGGAAPATVAVAPDVLRLTPEEERRLRRRLADLLVERAVEVVSVSEGPASNLDLGVELMLCAVEIDPDDADRWRVLLQAADLAENPDAARLALTNLGRLEPADEVVALRRLMGAIEGADTVEGRLAAYQQLLTSATIGQLGASSASRLSFDHALLLRRTGDIEGFAKWLAESVAIDPANPVAASTLTEFFGGFTADTAAVAELMLTRCLADPANVPAIEQLGAFLLARGAPVGARRALQLVVDLSGGVVDVNVGTLTLLVLATWLTGDADGALLLIDVRQRAEDTEFREWLSALQLSLAAGGTSDEALLRAVAGRSAPSVTTAQRLLNDGPLTTERVRAAVAPLWPDLAAARAAIHQVRGSSEAVTAARALTGIEMLDVELAVGDLGEPAPRAAAIANAVWWTLFLGDDVPAARTAMEKSIAIAPIDEPTKALIDGWLALREGRLGDAIAALTPCAESDPRCDLGLGVALLGGGERRLGASRLLSAARAMPGTVAGAWALETLYRELGARVPAWPGAAELESMASTLPATFDRLLLEPQRELSLVVRPTSPVFSPFDRIEANVEIGNRSALPLAIGPDGPIRDTIAMPFVMTTYGIESGTGALASPGLVDIGRRLVLEPRSQLSVRANLSRCLVSPGQTLGSMTRTFALRGSGVNINSRALLNPVPVPGQGAENRLVAGILGVESPPLSFRVESRPFDAEWRTAAVAAVDTLDRFEDLELLGTLALRAAQSDLSGLARLQPEQRAAVEEALREQVAAVEKAVPKLPPLAQAWLTMHLMPDRSQIAELASMLRASEDPLVRLASLVSITSGSQDPLLDQTQRGQDPTLRRIAELIAKALRRSTATPEPADAAGR